MGIETDKEARTRIYQHFQTHLLMAMWGVANAAMDIGLEEGKDRALVEKTLLLASTVYEVTAEVIGEDAREFWDKEAQVVSGYYREITKEAWDSLGEGNEDDGDIFKELYNIGIIFLSDFLNLMRGRVGSDLDDEREYVLNDGWDLTEPIASIVSGTFLSIRCMRTPGSP